MSKLVRKIVSQLMLPIVFCCSYYWQDVIVTAYTASVEECGKADGITASGVKAVEGRTVAADHLKFGTMVEIDGHIYITQDRFGGGYTDKIDIYMEDKQKALEWGVQKKRVKIYF